MHFHAFPCISMRFHAINRSGMTKRLGNTLFYVGSALPWNSLKLLRKQKSAKKTGNVRNRHQYHKLRHVARGTAVEARPLRSSGRRVSNKGVRNYLTVSNNFLICRIFYANLQSLLSLEKGRIHSTTWPNFLNKKSATFAVLAHILKSNYKSKWSSALGIHELEWKIRLIVLRDSLVHSAWTFYMFL